MDYNKAGLNGVVLTESEAEELANKAMELIDNTDITEIQALSMLKEYGWSFEGIVEWGLQDAYNKMVAEKAVDKAFKQLNWYGLPESMTVNVIDE